MTKIIKAEMARQNVKAWDENAKRIKRERTDEVLKRLSFQIEEFSRKGIESINVHNSELAQCDPNYFLETLEEAGYSVEVNQINYRIEW